MVRVLLSLIALSPVGCLSPPPPGNEWFIVVADRLAEAEHERFASDLRRLVDGVATPGDVVHVVVGSGLSFTGTAPWSSFEGCCDHPFQDAVEYLTATVYLEGLEDCGLELDTLTADMRRLRETDLPVRTLLVGCECPPGSRSRCRRGGHHSLAAEVLAERFHPEFRVPTRSHMELHGVF